MYLKSIRAGEGEKADKDLRELEFLKNNYGPLAATVPLHYQNGLFVPVEGPSGLNKLAAEREADELFLTLLKRFAEQGQRVSHKPGPTHAPTLCQARQRQRHQQKCASKCDAAASGRQQNSHCRRRPGVSPTHLFGAHVTAFQHPVQLPFQLLPTRVLHTPLIPLMVLEVPTRVERVGTPNTFTSRFSDFQSRRVCAPLTSAVFPLSRHFPSRALVWPHL
jgi:hypothetical protein